MGMFVVDVHHEKGAELIEVRYQYKPLVNIPVGLVNFDREGTAHDWSNEVGSEEVVCTLFGLLKGLAESGEWIIPESKQAIGVTRELVSAYYPGQVSSHTRTIEQCYIDSMECNRSNLSDHLAGILKEESRAYVMFSGPNGLKASFTKREILEMGRNYSDNGNIPGSMQTLKRAFIDAKDSLVDELCNQLPDWFGFTDDEFSHADEAAFERATEWFIQDPEGFWEQNFIEGLELTKVVGMGAAKESEKTPPDTHEYSDDVSASEEDDPLMGLSSPGTVLVVVSGGLVMDVYSEIPLDVVLIDRDAEGVPEEDLTPASEVGELLGKSILKSSKIARHIVSESLKLSNKISGATI